MINILSREQGLAPASPTDPASSDTLRYRRNSSRSRSRSQLDLTALNAAVKNEEKESATATATEERGEVRGRKVGGVGAEEGEGEE